MNTQSQSTKKYKGSLPVLCYKNCPICNEEMKPTTAVEVYYCEQCGKYYSEDDNNYVTTYSKQSL